MGGFPPKRGCKNSIFLTTDAGNEIFSIRQYIIIIITCWIRYFPRRGSWPDFVWSLSLLFLAISFDHMHPLSPVHFSSSHSLPAFSTFISIFLFLYYHSLQISKPSLSHFHLLSSKHDRTTVNCLL